MALRWFSKNRKLDQGPRLPTVRFDASRVTETVKADLWESIQEFEDLPVGEERAIYETALLSISRGRDLYILTAALIDKGVPEGRAGEIALILNNRASSMIDVDRKIALGIMQARWSYAGAPCFSSRSPTAADRRRDAAHRAADGTIYDLASGLLVNGYRTHPGREPGCKCFAKAIIPGRD